MRTNALVKEIEAQRGYLVRYARSQLNDACAAEDLAQDTLLAALTSVNRFEQRSSVRTWLTGILRHKITDARRVGGRERNFSSFGDDVDSGTPDDYFAGGTWGQLASSEQDEPFKHAACKRFMQDLRASMKKLPSNQCAALEMREIQGHETQDICRILNVSNTNLWAMICRAKATLRDGLGHKYANATSIF